MPIRIGFQPLGNRDNHLPRSQITRESFPNPVCAGRTHAADDNLRVAQSFRDFFDKVRLHAARQFALEAWMIMLFLATRDDLRV